MQPDTLTDTAKNCLFPQSRRQLRTQILMYLTVHCGSPCGASLTLRKNPNF